MTKSKCVENNDDHITFSFGLHQVWWAGSEDAQLWCNTTLIGKVVLVSVAKYISTLNQEVIPLFS